MTKTDPKTASDKPDVADRQQMRRAALALLNADVPFLHRQDAAWSVSNIATQKNSD